MSYSKSQMVQKLRTKRCFVIFRKSNGDKREMVCTLDFSRIPTQAIPVHEAPDIKDLIRVYDLEKEAWRSFHVSSVEKFSTRVPKEHALE